MLTELEFAIHRFATYAREVLRPAIYESPHRLSVAALQRTDPIPPAEAVGAEYVPVDVGWRWGPAWSTAWFHVTGSVPKSMAGRTVALRFSSGTEALLWEGGAPRRGFDRNRDSVILFEPAAGGETIDLHIEAACNHPFGITSFTWDTPETQARWESDAPGELKRCELAIYHHDVWRLWHAWEFARQLLAELPADSPRAQALYRALGEATRLVDDTDIARSAAEVCELLTSALHSGTPASTTQCFAVGHAHIDTAWLWPVRETRRKCLRSFANVLELMDRYDDFHFLCSQAQQYAWVEQDTPALFERISQRVRDGLWEPGGAMWVEPDCNLTSGESLIRQILHGTRYWRDKFGDHAPQTYLYLPDTFGFSAAIPQIMAQAGLKTFITNKLSWNQMNEWPHSTFIWRGLDGSDVLAHCTPGKDYNATNTPRELARGEMECARKDLGRTIAWLQPFGYGDGGGGPTEEMIDAALLAADCEGLPAVKLARADVLCDELHRRWADLSARGDRLPTWDGELYLELHRGTLTSQAWLKRANRRAEQDLRVVEWLHAASPADNAADPALLEKLGAMWKLVLTNQFHDILPGTSIGKVYEDSRQEYRRIEQFCAEAIDTGMAAWSRGAGTAGLHDPIMVLNPHSDPFTGVVECDDRLTYVRDIPALGAAVIDRGKEEPVAPVEVADGRLSNGIISARFDGEGGISDLRRVDDDRPVAAAGPGGSHLPLNQLMLYEDRPQAWDAWDVDRNHLEKPMPVAGPAERSRIVESSPLRGAIEFERPLGQRSRIIQRYVLAAGSPRLDIHTRIDWHENHRLLRALFPVDARSRHATYEIQFGHLDRPAHRNTAWDQARFEVCAHQWMDLSEPGFGAALLNDGKYGHSCDGKVIGITLLRSPKHPDPNADMGEHEFTYSIMPHAGDWRAAGVDRQARALNAPPLARAMKRDQTGAWKGAWAPFTIETHGAAHVDIAACKPAEDDDRTIVRLVETHGGAGDITLKWNLPVSGVEPVDILERPMTLPQFSHDQAERTTKFRLRPFQIVTLAASRM
ncbi:MAG: alpha-mannosidase [Phycisphaerales bacterium]|nr:MAG: alpha-mannosidase [Phycisphaerales bacterium]